jgi:hypothetical protein
MRAKVFLMASAFAPVWGMVGMSIAVPVVLIFPSFFEIACGGLLRGGGQSGNDGEGGSDGERSFPHGVLLPIRPHLPGVAGMLAEPAGFGYRVPHKGYG